MFIKKNLAILFVLAILVTTMAACGSATPSEPAAEASRGGDVSVENHDQSESGATDEPDAPIEGTVPSEVAYAKDNGCTQISYLDDTGSSTKDEGNAAFYTFYFGDWMVIPLGTGCTLTYLGDIGPDGFSTRSPEYSILAAQSLEDFSNGREISISKNNTAHLNDLCISVFDTIVFTLNANPDSMDPLSDTNLNYSQMR